MFFCETCRVRNGWPESMAQSLGACEMCNGLKVCYDVPSKLLPTNILNTRNDGAHRSHCCQLHGCKYGHDDCIVKLYGNQEYPCYVCTEEIYQEGGWEEAHLMNEMFDRGRRYALKRMRRLVQETRRKHK